MITGMYHVGFGVQDRDKSINFYQKYLGCGRVKVHVQDFSQGGFGRFVGEGEKFHWSMLAHSKNSVDYESVLLLSRKPVPIPSNYKWGDVGFNDITLRVTGLSELYQHLKKEGVKVLSDPQRYEVNGWTKKFFYLQDPDGVNIKFEQDSDDGKRQPEVLGYHYTCIGVTDLERSIWFYDHALGLSQVVWDVDGHLHWMDALSGEKVVGRTAMLSSHYDEYKLQLVQIRDRLPNLLWKGKRWGDQGLMEYCVSVESREDLDRICSELKSRGVPILVPPQQTTPFLDYSFIAYVGDPDGNYVEYCFHDKTKKG
jgi:catechol 2,3-dioxygenase-like lactoylglutathione lyase family enzyme